MTAAPRVLYIDQGATYYFGFTWHRDGPEVDGVITPGDPYDLSGCLVRMQIRRKKGDPVLVTATSAEPEDEAAINAGAGRIILEGGPGRPQPGHIGITLTDQDTDALVVKSAVFDLEVVWPMQPGDLRPRVDRPLKGTVTVDPNITTDQ